MKALRLPLLLGLAHGAADGSAGLLLGHLPQVMRPMLAVTWLVLLYNALAFGCQPLAGWLADTCRRPRAFALGGLMLLAGALMLAAAGQSWTLAVALAGVGSAGFHVGAGALALRASEGRADGPGIFAAPGVIGLAAGGALAVGGYFVCWPFLVLLVGLGGMLLAMRPPPPMSQFEAEEVCAEAHAADAPALEAHDWLMIVLLSAVALRSAVWTSVQLALEGRAGMLLAVAAAAAVGKVLGGLLAGRVGWRRWTVGALSLAAPLLALGDRRPGCLLGGVALLQSATPVALAAMSRLLPSRPATATGLTFGLAVALGGLPSLFGGAGGGKAALLPLMVFLLTLAAAAGFGLAMRRQRQRSVRV